MSGDVKAKSAYPIQTFQYKVSYHPMTGWMLSRCPRLVLCDLLSNHLSADCSSSAPSPKVSRLRQLCRKVGHVQRSLVVQFPLFDATRLSFRALFG